MLFLIHSCKLGISFQRIHDVAIITDYTVCSWPQLYKQVHTTYTELDYSPRGLALKIKAQRLFPSDKLMGVFSGSRQVNALRGVC